MIMGYQVGSPAALLARMQCFALDVSARFDFFPNFQAGFVFREAAPGSASGVAQSDLWRLAAGRVVYRE
jgi:hypothetical protein